MRILITGAGGTLGTALAPQLADAGHEPVLFDIAPIDSSYEVIVGDVRHPPDMRRAAEGAEMVVHAAAVHGIHLRDHSPQDFYELNLTGTFNAWEAAVEAGVRGFVFSSTMGVYGHSGRPEREDEVVALHEETPLQPGDIYGYTKVAGEEMCRYYVRRNSIPSLALRYGMFVPEPFFHYGIRLLYGGVDAEDVAACVVAAVLALAARRFSWDVFNVHSLVPFTAEEGPQLRRDPLEVVDRHYPGAGDLLRERGIPRLNPILAYFPMARAEERLGFRPQRNFDQWLDKLRTRPEERAPATGPWW
jgi:UDP-glucose 4-epimerase